MSVIELPLRHSRGRFIATHLAAVLGLSIAGFVLGFIVPFAHLPGLIGALAPLARLSGAQGADRATLVMSTVCALLFLGCTFGLLMLVYLDGLAQGSRH